MKDELGRGYLNHAGQELMAFSEQTCFVVLSTSVCTDAMLSLGTTSFGELLAAMDRLSVTAVGTPEYGKTCILVRHKHPDPAMEGQYSGEHIMPCMPARGVLHDCNTAAEEWGAHLLEVRVGAS